MHFDLNQKMYFKCYRSYSNIIYNYNLSKPVELFFKCKA